MASLCPHSQLMVLLFIVGYFFITIEHYTKINKATVALLMAIGCWTLQFANSGCLSSESQLNLEHNLADIAQIVFFLLGALIVVEVINQHKGFNILSRYLNFSSKKTMLWVITLISFFLSGILDNLTTTVVMITLLKKLIDSREDRLLIGGGIVIAANAGGAWTPIGDVTTTMLWIGEQVSTLNVMKVLFIPSLACMIASNLWLSKSLKGTFRDKTIIDTQLSEKEPQGIFILILGIALLIFVPILKIWLGVPPFMGMLFAVSILWLVTDLLHDKYDDRAHLRIQSILSKIDLSTIFFFVGILLSVGALYSAGILTELSEFLDAHVNHLPLMALIIGFASAIVDNVPLVAATMGMYSLTIFSTDHTLWNMIAYCAGVGGSLLIIGSAAGVVFMGMEKVDFLWYVRRISFSALIGYLVGFFLYLWL